MSTKKKSKGIVSHIIKLYKVTHDQDNALKMTNFGYIILLRCRSLNVRRNLLLIFQRRWNAMYVFCASDYVHVF